MGGWKPEGWWMEGQVQGGWRACGRRGRDWSLGGLCPQAWASRPCLKVFERLPNGDLSLDISSQTLSSQFSFLSLCSRLMHPEWG